MNIISVDVLLRRCTASRRLLQNSARRPFGGSRRPSDLHTPQRRAVRASPTLQARTYRPRPLPSISHHQLLRFENSVHYPPPKISVLKISTSGSLALCSPRRAISQTCCHTAVSPCGLCAPCLVPPFAFDYELACSQVCARTKNEQRAHSREMADFDALAARLEAALVKLRAWEGSASPPIPSPGDSFCSRFLRGAAQLREIVEGLERRRFASVPRAPRRAPS